MPLNYEILVEGRLDPCWSEWLEGMCISPHDSGGTLLSGELVDQCALYGLLNRLRDMNLKLVWVRQGAG
jgi:hypothetical protein